MAADEAAGAGRLERGRARGTRSSCSHIGMLPKIIIGMEVPGTTLTHIYSHIGKYVTKSYIINHTP